MTLLSVVKDVCATVGVLVPQSVFSNITGNRTMQEMVALANEMAQRIAYDSREWTTLRLVATLDGDGGVASPAYNQTILNLPANFKRLLLTSNVRRSTDPLTPMRFVPDADQWLERRLSNKVDSCGEWNITGINMFVSPPLSTSIPAIPEDPGPPPVPAQPAVPAQSVTFVYLDKNCIALNSGGYGDRFMDDLDSFRLDERLLKLGMIWQWKAQKGSAYAEDMGTYGDALTYAMGHDQPAPIILGRKTMSAAARVAYPWPVPS